MLRKTISHLLIVGCGALFVGACSSMPDIEDVMGLGKAAPDESQVKVHQMLAMPPDYQLRPPTEGVVNNNAQPNPYALPALTPGGTPQVTQPTTVANADPSAPGPTAISPGQNNPNVQHGVSTVNPDGTPKTKRQITDELKQKRIEQERKKNASYGTVYNIGSIFSDW